MNKLIDVVGSNIKIHDYIIVSRYCMDFAQVVAITNSTVQYKGLKYNSSIQHCNLDQVLVITKKLYDQLKYQYKQNTETVNSC